MNIVKGGWHPAGDKKISRETWKSDLKNIATGKNPQSDRAKDHVSTPLGTLKDPDSFGPPPKHTAYYGEAQASSSSARPTTTTKIQSTGGGLGSPVPAPSRNTAQRGGTQEQEEVKPSVPYRVNTTGLQTDHFSAPPKPGRANPVTPVTSSPARARPVPVVPTTSNATQARPVPSLPPRAAGPPPGLPPRQSENPSEYEPAGPPSYGEAVQQTSHQLNHGAVNRLANAGVSVPDLGVGGSTNQASAAQGHGGQLNELQQRFARMNATGKSSSETSPISPAGVAGKKKPPPPPAKKAELHSQPTDQADSAPPIPTASKPRPG